MSKISISLAGDTKLTSESKGKKSGKSKTPRQQFFSELMKRLAGDPGNQVADAFVNDKKKFKGMMMKIAGEMASVDDADE